MSSDVHTRRRVIAAVAAAGLAAVAVVLVLLLSGGSSPAEPPADAAAMLVPQDALVYLHVSTDMTRPATAQALALVKRFPSYARERDSLLKRLSAPQCGSTLKGVKGKEAALALVDTGEGQAGSLVIIDTGKNAPRQPAHSCGVVETERIGHFLVIGQPQTVPVAEGLFVQHGKGSLGRSRSYVTQRAALPADRVADGWVSADGITRLLAPQSGVLGAAGVLLDQPGLADVAFGLSASGHHAHLFIRSVKVAKEAKGAVPFKTFSPSLQKHVPDGALAYLGLSGLNAAAERLLSAAGSSAATLGPLLARAEQQLVKQSGGTVGKNLLDLFKGEVALAITPASPAPLLTLQAGAPDPAGTARTLQAVQVPLAKLLGRPKQAPPQWTRHGDAWQLVIAPGAELDYAVHDGELIVATGLRGITLAEQSKGKLAAGKAYKAVEGDAPKRVGSLVFLDFGALLRLAEQTGLNASAAYKRVRGDLHRIAAVGAHTTSEPDESTAELNLSIP